MSIERKRARSIDPQSGSRNTLVERCLGLKLKGNLCKQSMRLGWWWRQERETMKQAVSRKRKKNKKRERERGGGGRLNDRMVGMGSLK